jgi:hypothetical protein
MSLRAPDVFEFAGRCDDVAGLGAAELPLSPDALERRVTNEVTGASDARLRPGPGRGGPDDAAGR